MEEPYVLNMDVMEDDFYDGMYAFLQSRGIDDDFIAELVNITTDMESNNYRQLLVDMKAFVEWKLNYVMKTDWNIQFCSYYQGNCMYRRCLSGTF